MDTTDPERERRFTELFDAHHADVLGYALRRLGPDLAHDAVAETFLAAWRNLDRSSGDPLVWLYSLARGAVSHQRRRAGRAARLSERLVALDPGTVAPDHADDVGWEDPFDAAFRQLREPEREVLRLVAWEGLGAAEAAAVVGCSVTAFKVRLHRARRRLRQLLDTDHVDCAAAPDPFVLPLSLPKDAL